MISTFYVPVVDKNQNPLMPTKLSRARKWIESGKATPFWKKGIFCVRLNEEPSDNKKQDIALGIDPGSKKEGFTVKSAAHTELNIQQDAIDYVKDKVKTRREMRRGRRFRKTPCRKCRNNRNSLKKGRIPPSTKARWISKINTIIWLKKLFPINYVVVEDIKTKTTGKPKWDKSFSPLEVGKKWFYEEVKKIVPDLVIKQGYETKYFRDLLGLKKLKDKMSNDFHAHCVDSWVLAYIVVGGSHVDNKAVYCISRIKFHKRQLHYFLPSKSDNRSNYGGTLSLGLVRGSLVKHKKFGIVYVGGTSSGRISLHDVTSGKRLCQNAKVEDCKFLCYNKIRYFAYK